MKRTWAVWLLLLAGCDDGPDEWNCELTVQGTPVCVDADTKRVCEGDYGGDAVAAELQPGGPFEYCDDLGYPVMCPGSIDHQGDDGTISLSYYAATDEDCDAARDGQIE